MPVALSSAPDVMKTEAVTDSSFSRYSCRHSDPRCGILYWRGMWADTSRRAGWASTSKNSAVVQDLHDANPWLARVGNAEPLISMLKYKYVQGHKGDVHVEPKQMPQRFKPLPICSQILPNGRPTFVFVIVAHFRLTLRPSRRRLLFSCQLFGRRKTRTCPSPIASLERYLPSRPTICRITSLLVPSLLPTPQTP